MSRITFVTGTGTGVGKTLLTSALLFHLRQDGVSALAMKPFCSGATADVDLIQAIQGQHPPRDEVNPFYFTEPVAPLVAARKHRRRIRLLQASACVQRMKEQCDHLIVEGAGGLLVPLGEGFSVADLITTMDCDVIVVSRNKLGVINESLLSLEALRARGVQRVRIVLMNQSSSDLSAKTNAVMLRELAVNVEVFEFPYLGKAETQMALITRGAKKIKKTLATILEADTFSVRSSGRLRKSKRNERLKTKKVR